MAKGPESPAEIEATWRAMIEKGEVAAFNKKRKLFYSLPSNTRCKFCYAPFRGIGGAVVRTIYGTRPSRVNPHMCNACDDFADKYQGGVEIVLSMLFADIRGSTTLAESMPPAEFRRLIDRFYKVSTHILTEHDSAVDKLAGDQVSGYFLPGFATDHAGAALRAAEELLRATGHGSPEGPWVGVGVGVHTGNAFYGAVGQTGGMVDVTALGDNVNVTARLASSAAAGEILTTPTTLQAAGRSTAGLEMRRLELKGKSEPVDVYVLHAPA
ncbi:MAG: adenylate/guanylate cyclase domain-containing protein [Anaerolineae bacterium]|nr:MAG: adenylate/guanylate cyclase domain-containing protein [Anaerolineae bacterium]